MIDIQEIEPLKANELALAGALFIDVREAEEIEEQAYIIPNIKNIPYSTFDENYLDIPKEIKLILVCRSGIRSLRVAQFLVIQGWDIDNIYNLQGGILAWTSDRLPTKTGKRIFRMVKPQSSCGCNSFDPCC
jgi:rhodanese-related sulfurtransferase